MLAVAVVVASFLLCEIYDLGVWWHFEIGREILTSGAIPAVDRWTVLGAGRPYHDSQWLFRVVLPASHRVAGWVGVQAVMVGLWGLTIAPPWGLAQRRVWPAAYWENLLRVEEALRAHSMTDAENKGARR